MDDNKDKYIKDMFKKDDLISKNADDIFNKFIKGEIEVEEMDNQNKEVEITDTKEKVIDINEAKEKRKNNKWKKKAFSAVASVAILFVAVNTYATTQGYENIFFMIKDLINKDGVSIESKEEILSDRDITISYQPIEISEDLKIQINNLTIKENVAELTLTLNENENIVTRPYSYEVYDITSGEKSLLANQASIIRTDSLLASAPGSSYTESLILKNFKNDTKILELDVYAENEELLISFEINIEEKEIDVLSRREIAFEKISEVELKDILSKYVALNYYDDTDTIGYINSTAKQADNSLIAELGVYLVSEKSDGINGDLDLVNKAMHEITGKTYTEGLDIFEESFIHYDSDKKEYYFDNGDGFIVPGLCLDISDISFKNGIYKVTCIYCFPGEGDYLEGNIANLEQYKTTFELTINEDYSYAKYRIVNYDNLTSEKVKDSDKIDNEVPDNTVSNTVNQESTNTISNTTRPNNNVTNITNTTTVIKPNDDKINSQGYISFIEDVIRVNFFNDKNAVTEHYTKEEYENEMKLLSAFEIAGGDFMTYEQQNMIFKELFNEDVKNIIGSNIVIENTGGGYKYISKDHYAFASVLQIVEDVESNGINTVTVIYTYGDKNATIYDDCDKYEVTFKYKENSNYSYSKYQVVNLNEMIRKPDGNSSNSEIVDNYASSLDWKKIYSIGLETLIPTTWETIEFDDYYDGEDKEQHGEVAICILGQAKGIKKETNEIVYSNVQINYFTPMFIRKDSKLEAQEYIEELLGLEATGDCQYIFETGMQWEMYRKEGTNNQYYCHMSGFEDGIGVCRMIEVETSNWDNMKLVNIINRMIANTKGCSF